VTRKIFYCLAKRVTLLRRSTILSISSQLIFPESRPLKFLMLNQLSCIVPSRKTG
jgi:hypothetical protein